MKIENLNVQEAQPEAEEEETEINEVLISRVTFLMLCNNLLCEEEVIG